MEEQGRKNLNLKINKTLFIGIHESKEWPFPFPIDSKDMIIDEIRFGNKKSTLFMGGIAIERLYQLILRMTGV